METKLGTFNNVDKADVEKYLEKLSWYYEVADAKKTYWQNADDTLVLVQKEAGTAPSPGVGTGIVLGNLPWKLNADEFDTMIEDYRHYIRIWWD